MSVRANYRISKDCQRQWTNERVRCCSVALHFLPCVNGDVTARPGRFVRPGLRPLTRDKTLEPRESGALRASWSDSESQTFEAATSNRDARLRPAATAGHCQDCGGRPGRGGGPGPTPCRVGNLGFKSAELGRQRSSEPRRRVTVTVPDPFKSESDRHRDGAAASANSRAPAWAVPNLNACRKCCV